MKRFSTTFHISLSMTAILVILLVAAHFMGILPDMNAARWDGRRALCETVAVDCSLALERHDHEMIRRSLQAVVTRRRDLLRASLIKDNGDLVLDVRNATPSRPEGADLDRALDIMTVPLVLGKKRWGHIELGFSPLAGGGFVGFFQRPTPLLLVFLTASGFLAFLFYLRHILRHLDPSEIVPHRVQHTLDTLAEGLVVVDKSQRIVLANNAFSDVMKSLPDTLLGKPLSDFSWLDSRAEATHRELPWGKSLRTGQTNMGELLRYSSGDKIRTYRINSSPILDDKGNCQGALASFDDVTELEERNQTLSRMLDKLKVSRDQIRRQNQELQILATRDSLTGALNRRSFFEQFDSLWRLAQQKAQCLCCIMVDVDHFKAINDNYGHATGDEVLKGLVRCLKDLGRDTDLICRYGGEEFCIVLPNADAEAGEEIAERYRGAVSEFKLGRITITASFGVSSTEFGADSPQLLLDEADKALYVAKRNGRDQVSVWDELPDDTSTGDAHTTCRRETANEETRTIPFQTVTALTSAMAFRDPSTAEHSRRVADLCVALAQDLMPLRDAYILENAALLHDIGKIGVPDSVLLKPGKLEEDEWQMMRAHERIGEEIIRSTFACRELSEIVRFYNVNFEGDSENEDVPRELDIPLGARILAICDSYDAMTSDRVYRKGISHDDAIAELQRCAGTQFDPGLVERFVDVINCQRQTSRTSVESVDKQGALEIGIQMQHIAEALDRRDGYALSNVSQRLAEAADRCGITPISLLARDIETCLSQSDADIEETWMQVMRQTLELLELCRQTQRTYLDAEAREGMQHKGM